jgi:thioredoxin-dependent peroxiredoxin
VRLGDLKGGPAIVYFFPKAGTYGCTRESLDFAQLHEQFRERGVSIVGISVDTVEAQRDFGAQCRLPFPLLADPGKEIARAYGVLGAFGYARRVTYLLDREGRVTEVVISPFPGTHVERAKAVLLEGEPVLTRGRSRSSTSRDTPSPSGR